MFYFKFNKMKRLLVIVPAILLVLFLINSFILKEKDGAKIICNKSGLVNIVFRSTDGGQTWQDISQGLPENLQIDSSRGNSLFANDKGLFLRVGKGLYHSTPNATAPFWKKEIVTDEHSSIAPGKSGLVGNNYWGVNVKKTDGTSVWSPIFDHSHEPRLRSAFETAGGVIFIGTDEGFFKTANSGKTWKLVYAGGFVGHLAEANGVLLAIGMKRIIRSTNDGENWSRVISEDSVAFDVKQINGGFAAITSNSALNTPNTSRISTSYDGGKTWQPNNAGNKVLIDSISRTWDDRPDVKAFMTYIIQVGENVVCVHRDGIYKSSDKGKTWKLVLSSIEGKNFNLSVSGNVIYAIPSKGGC
jgi:photosystem II stability/assembly factor-like uncharacterized protein